MKIREIMTTNVEIAEADDTLDDIATMMRDQDVGAIPVVEDGELIGIVTDRDIVVRCVAEGKDPSEIAVDEIISGELHTVEPDDDVDLARRIMSEQQIRRLPVVEDGKLIGMLSLGDMAVKTDEEVAVADTLEDISEGVKASVRNAMRGGRAQKSAKAPQSGKTTQAEKTAQQRSKQAVSHQGGRQESLENGGRQQQSIRGRIEEQDRGQVDRRQDAGSRKQGISSHAAPEEVERQNRVVPIRSQQRTNVRGERRAKSPSGRKTG